MVFFILRFIIATENQNIFHPFTISVTVEYIPGENHEYHITKGWNLIGYPMSKNKDASEFIDSHPIDRAFYWDMDSTKYKGLVINQQHSQYGEDFVMKQGNAYFVFK